MPSQPGKWMSDDGGPGAEHDRRRTLRCGGAAAALLLLQLVGQAAWHPAAAAVGAWSPIGPPGGGTVTAVAFAPSDASRVYAGLAGGAVQRSDDGGVTWRPSSFGISNPLVHTLAVDPADPDKVFAGTQRGFFRSADGGSSWLTSSPVNALKVHAIAVDPARPRVIYVGTDKGIYRSDDGGARWLQLTVGLIPTVGFDFEVVVLAMDPVAPAEIYAAHIGVRDGLNKTVNGGRSWATLRSFMIDALAVDPVDDTTVWAAGNDGVFKSADGGHTWTKVRLEPAHVLLFDPFGTGRLYAANPQDLQVTTDGGASWQTLGAGSLPGGALSLAADPSQPGRLLAGTAAAGVYGSADHGQSWAASGQGLVNQPAAAVALDDVDAAIFVAAPGGIYRTLDGGATWGLATFAGLDCSAVVTAPSDPRTVYAVAPGSIAHSLDGGAGWQVASGVQAIDLAVALDDPATVYAATADGLMKSTDGGTHWTTVFKQPVFTVAIDPLAPAVVYLLSFNQLWRSADRGDTWTMLLSDGPLLGLAIGHDAPRTILVSDPQSVFGSTDGGKTWSVLARQRLLPLALAVDPLNPMNLYIGSEAGVERSTDGGAHWSLFNRGLYARGLNQLLFDPNDPFRLYAASAAAGVFVFDFAH